MKTIQTIAIAAAVTVLAGPAFAACAETADAPAYRLSVDATRQLYCLRIFDNDAVADPRPARRGLECLSEARWAKRGIHFQWVDRASTRLAAD